MDSSSHLYLYRRHWLSIAIITVLSVATVAIFTVVPNPSTHEGTLFLSIGVRQTQDMSTSYDDVQAADQFAETVQGWFKNPNLIGRIEERSGGKADLSARKQEKQNLIVSFDAVSEVQARQLADATIEELRSEIQAYNAETESNYTLALAHATITEEGTRAVLFIILAVILGIALGTGLAYLYEYLFGIASFRGQVEEVFGKKSDETITPRAKSLTFLSALIAKLPHHKTLIIGITTSAKEIQEKLSKEPEVLTFPRDAEQMTDLHNRNIVVACKLGKSRLEDIQKIASFLPAEYLLVTIY